MLLSIILSVSFFKDRAKTVQALRSALRSGAGLAPTLRGMFIALLFGTLPTGPLYAAFPLSKGLLDKGASPANVFIFLSAWACIKIPQEMALVFQRLLGKKPEGVTADV